jgi:hypothetical protein
MLGYFFYTASDYFGIHTVYYTPLIIALAKYRGHRSQGSTPNRRLHHRRRFRSDLFRLVDPKI